MNIEEFMDIQQIRKPENHKETYFSDIIGIEDAVLITGYKKSTLYQKTSRNTIPFHKRNNKVVFKRSELEAWMLEHRQDTIEERLRELDQKFLANKKA